MLSKEILPFKNKSSNVEVVGSKSITNRAFVLSYLKGSCQITGALSSRDTLLMQEAIKELSLKKNEYNIFVGNAGTVARFFTAVCALEEGKVFNFSSDEAMEKRPIGSLIKVLEEQGSKFEFLKEKYCFPFKMTSGGVRGGNIDMDASKSSQLLSAILMILPFAKNKSTVKLSSQSVSKPFIDMTLKMMKTFGAKVICENFGSYIVNNNKYNASKIDKYKVEVDASAASYFIALPIILGGEIFIKNLQKDSLQGDIEFAFLLQRLNLIDISWQNGGALISKKDDLKEDISINFNDFSDTFLTLAAIAPLLGKKIEITGISHTRIQETDRVLAMKNELSKITKVEDTFDSLTIYPLEKLPENLPIKIETYEDHRVAMSFAILGSYDLFKNKKVWIQIEDYLCCKKTFPSFFEKLEEIKNMNNIIVAIDGGAAVGKSSVSKQVAKNFNLLHIDTGSHYRSVCFSLLEANLSYTQVDQIKAFLEKCPLEIVLNDGKAAISINGTVPSDSQLRNKLVNDNVSHFASIPELRQFLLDFQRKHFEFANKNGFNGIVMEGRDIATVVFPDANVKIFLDANEQTRALRRQKEGIADSISKRDSLDKNRKVAPLVPSETSHIVDTSYMNLDEVIEEVSKYVKNEI